MGFVTTEIHVVEAASKTYAVIIVRTVKVERFNRLHSTTYAEYKWHQSVV